MTAHRGNAAGWWRTGAWLVVSAVLTAAQPVAATTPTPSATTAPTPWRTGDLGVKHVVGRVYDAAAGRDAGIAGATVSFVGGTATTDAHGDFGFDIFLHDTTSTSIDVAAAGYLSMTRQFTGTELYFSSAVDFALVRSGEPTPQATVTATPTYDVCPPALMLTPDHAPPGDPIDLRGRCYYVHSGQTVRVLFDDVLVASGIADTLGNYSFTFSIPLAAAPGGHVVTTTSVTGREIGRAPLVVDLPDIPTQIATPSPTPRAVRTGDLGTKTIEGTVYDAQTGETIGIPHATVSYEAPGGSGSVDASFSGFFSFDLFLHDTDSIVIRASAPGFEPAQRSFGGLELWQSPPLTFGLTRQHGLVGIVAPDVDCTAPGRPTVQVRVEAVSGDTPPQTLSLDDGGTFVLADLADGDYVVSAQSTCPLSLFPPQRIAVEGGDGFVVLSAERCPAPILVEPAQGPPGAQIEITGRCYYAHSGATVRVLFDGAPLAVTQGDTTGGYHAALQVPDDAPLGPHTIRTTIADGSEVFGTGQFVVGGPSNACLGDCNGDDAVRIDELLRLVGIALGEIDIATCAAALPDGAASVDIGTVIAAVGVALDGCPGVGPTPVAPLEGGVCFSGPTCQSGGSVQSPITTTRAYCCMRQTQLDGVAVRWCPQDQYDEASGTCTACSAPC